MKFNYGNFKEKLPIVEERDGYAGVQAWGLEYYKYAMEELEKKQDELYNILGRCRKYEEKENDGSTTHLILDALAKLTLIHEILGESHTFDTTARNEECHE